MKAIKIFVLALVFCGLLSSYLPVSAQMNNDEIKKLTEDIAKQMPACGYLKQDIKLNAKGNIVDLRSLQEFLETQGYLSGNVSSMSESLDKTTSAALKNFQKDVKLKQTGYLDSVTRERINYYVCKSDTAPWQPNPQNNTLKDKLSTIMTNGELIHDTTFPNGYGNVNVSSCTKPTAGSFFSKIISRPVDPTNDKLNLEARVAIYDSVQSALIASKGTGYCHSTAKSWVVFVPLKVPEGIYKYWCADSEFVFAGKTDILRGTSCNK